MITPQPPGNETPLTSNGEFTQAWAAFFQACADMLAREVPNGTAFANDAAAAVGGVALGGLYYNGTIIRARLV